MLNTIPAVYTFHITNLFNIHLACLYARIAAYALVCVNLNPEKSYGIKEGVNRSQGTYKSAKCSVDEHARYNYKAKNKNFPRKK